MAKLPATNITTSLVANAIGVNSNNVGELFLHPNVNEYGWGDEAGGEKIRNWGKRSPDRLNSYNSAAPREAPLKLGAFRGYDHNWAHYIFRRLYLSGRLLSYRSIIANDYQTNIDFDEPTNETITINYDVRQKWYSAASENLKSYSSTYTATINISEVNETINLNLANSSIIAESDYLIKINSVTDSHGGDRFGLKWPTYAPENLPPWQVATFQVIEKNDEGFVLDSGNYYLKSKVNTNHIGFGYASPIAFEYYSIPANIDNLAELDIWFINYSNLVCYGKVDVEVRKLNTTNWVNITTYGGGNENVIVYPCEFSTQLNYGVYSRARVEISLDAGDAILNTGDEYEMRITITPDNWEQWDNISIAADYNGDMLPNGFSVTRQCRGIWRNF